MYRLKCTPYISTGTGLHIITNSYKSLRDVSVLYGIREFWALTVSVHENTIIHYYIVFRAIVAYSKLRRKFQVIVHTCMYT